MILKSLTATAVSMAAAAGAVWMGTAPADAHPHKSVKPTETKDMSDSKSVVETMVKRKSDAAESRVVVTAEAESEETQDLPTKPMKSQDNDGERRWLDKYLEAEAKPEKEKPAYTLDPKEVTERDDAPKAMRDMEKRFEEMAKERMDSDKADKKITKEDVNVDIAISDGETRIERIRKMGSDTRREKVVLPYEMTASDADAVMSRLRKGDKIADVLPKKMMETPSMASDKTKEARIRIEMPDMPEMQSEALRTFTKAEPGKLLEATKLIQDDELRDQALFSIVTYSLRFDDFDSADTALGKIDDDTLASNARARVAIRQAELGDIGTALKTIESIDDKELQDIIRVQMIETLTTPLEKRDMQ